MQCKKNNQNEPTIIEGVDDETLNKIADRILHDYAGLFKTLANNNEDEKRKD